MKKTLISAAIAASILAPVSVAMADTKVYGAIRTSVLLAGEKGGADLGGVVNNASRLGVKGSYGEEGGLTGFFNIQEGVETDANGGSGFENRFAMAGVKGGFGTVVVGRLSSPYKMAGLKVDPFYDTSAGTGNGGSNYGLSSLTNGWLNNVVGYISPKFGGGFSANLVAVLGENDNDSLLPGDDGKGENFFNPGITYSSNGITAGVQHITELEATRLTLGYKAGSYSAGVSYEDNAGGIDGAEAIYLAGSYKMGKSTLAASYGTVDGTDVSTTVGGVTTTNAATGFETQGSGFALGLFHKVAPRTTITAIYSDVDADVDAGDRDQFSVGLIQAF